MNALGFPGGSQVKNPPTNAGDAGDTGLASRSGRSPGGGNGDPLQCSCLENPMDRGAWWATVHRVAKSQIQISMKIGMNGFLIKICILSIEKCLRMCHPVYSCSP